MWGRVQEQLEQRRQLSPSCTILFALRFSLRTSLLSQPPHFTTTLHYNVSTLSFCSVSHHTELTFPTRCRASTTNTTNSGGIADTISNAASYVTETVKEYTAGASKEGNKVSSPRRRRRTSRRLASELTP